MAEFAVDRERAAIYAPFVLDAAPRLLSQLDREPHSVTYGSFDRDHWSWKFRDFPILMTQWAVLPIALLARLDLPGNPYRSSENLLEWARAALRVLCERQHKSGAWDTVGPNNQDHGGALGSIYYLVETARALGDALTNEDRARITGCTKRAVRFAERSAEDHAFISNHHGLFALGWLAASEWLGDAALARRAEATVREILARQHADGFYCEYNGFDPGYEALGIQYLARYWERTRDAGVLASLRRAVEFFAHAVHPDGSVGGAYGSRHTRLYFPAGFEILAAEIPEAAGVAAFMCARLARGEVVTPANVDSHNAYVVNLSYLHACSVTTSALAPAALPCESLRGERHFESGLLVAGTESYYAVFAMQKGGVCRVHARATGELAYEDAGSVLRSGENTYASQMLGLSRFGERSDEGADVITRARFGLVRQEQLTPFRFVVLRLLNLTLFRSAALGNWIRRAVIERLITATAEAPVSLERRVRFLDDRIEIHDTIRLKSPLAVDALSLARGFTGIHMGSAKYFHASQTARIETPSTAGLAERLTRERACELRFSVNLPQKS